MFPDADSGILFIEIKFQCCSPRLACFMLVAVNLTHSLCLRMLDSEVVLHQ